MSEFQRFMKYFVAQANDNAPLLARLVRQYESDCDSTDDRDLIKRLARM